MAGRVESESITKMQFNSLRLLKIVYYFYSFHFISLVCDVNEWSGASERGVVWCAEMRG